MLKQYQTLTGKPFNSRAVAGPTQYRRASPVSQVVQPVVNQPQQQPGQAA